MLQPRARAHSHQRSLAPSGTHCTVGSGRCVRRVRRTDGRLPAFRAAVGCAAPPRKLCEKRARESGGCAAAIQCARLHTLTRQAAAGLHPHANARGQTQTHIVRCARPQTAHVRHNFGLRVCVSAAFSSANLAATAALKPVSSARHLSPLALSDYSPTTRSGWAAPDAMARWSFKVVRHASGLPPTVHVMLKPPEATRSAFADADVARPMSCPPRAAVAYVNLAKGRRMGDSRRTPMARFSTMQLRGGPIHSNADWAGVQSRASHMLSAHRLG